MTSKKNNTSNQQENLSSKKRSYSKKKSFNSSNNNELPTKPNRKRYPNKKNKKTTMHKQAHHARPKHQKKKKGRSKWHSNRISEHFLKRDFDSRCNECTSNLRVSLGLVGVIEAIRSKLNKRVNILKGFTCACLKERTYGVKRDFHCSGIAADIQVEGIENTLLFKIIESSFPEVKGIGLNLDGDGYVHIDTRKEDDRECWVETNHEWILLTDENRYQYLPENSTEDDMYINSTKDNDQQHSMPTGVIIDLPTGV